MPKSTKRALAAIASIAAIGAALTFLRRAPHATIEPEPPKSDAVETASSSNAAMSIKPAPAPVPVSLPAPVVDRKAYYKVDAALSPEEERAFFQEITTVFLELQPAVVDSEQLMPHVIKLNERYRRGVRSILNKLATPAHDDKQVRDRLGMIDYLTYRLKWDERARQDVSELVSAAIPSDASLRYKAAAYGEKLELFAGLVNNSWSVALETLSQIKDPYLAQKAAQLAYAVRLESGAASASTEDEIKLVVPSFKNQAKS